ncbi:hypothetical protein [Halomarina oriensis]|uniref:Uncharacterized protein n=1 Tax=Halomarina oriensis TaxID=671145 RepID=A0A6B0GWS7_9EURY|nr:hypothetical protein [Halomarina oriensis]MWG36208.1 hypothetical protein [Halomarina oriensis]
MAESLLSLLATLFFCWTIGHGVSAVWVLRCIGVHNLDEGCPDGWHLNFLGRWPFYPFKAGWYGPEREYVAIRPHWLFPLLCKIDRIPAGRGYGTKHYQRECSWILPPSAIAWVTRHVVP